MSLDYAELNMLIDICHHVATYALRESGAKHSPPGDKFQKSATSTKGMEPAIPSGGQAASTCATVSGMAACTSWPL